MIYRVCDVIDRVYLAFLFCGQRGMTLRLSHARLYMQTPGPDVHTSLVLPCTQPLLTSDDAAASTNVLQRRTSIISSPKYPLPPMQ